MLLLLLQFVQVVIQAVETFLPEAAVFLDPVGRVLEGLGIEAAGSPLGFSPAGDQAGPLQDLQSLEIPGREMSKGWANCMTDCSPRERRARMARRVGSERAEKMVLRVSGITLSNG